MSERTENALISLCGLVGAIVLTLSFAINPGPPPGSTVAQMAEFTRAHHDLIVLSSWTQGMGSLLLVVFALGLVRVAGAEQRLSGWLTLLSGSTILMVSLIEVAGYLTVLAATESGDVTTGLVAAALIKGVQHIFLITLALLLPLGVVLWDARLLPRPFAYTALALGATLQVFGLLGLFNLMQPVIDVLLSVQSVWFVAASIALLLRPARGQAARPTTAVVE